MPEPATTLEQLTAKADRLYSLPAVAIEVLRLTESPKVDLRALKECIENDPALTAKILRVVNSSLFGLSRSVSDLSQALALLGCKPLKLLVLGFSLPPSLFAGVEAETLGRYWQHTLTRAVAARALAESLFNLSGDEAFIAGLLRDLGLLLLLQELGQPYAALLDRVEGTNQDLIALETGAMGFDHVALSAALLARWGLPEPIVQGVASAAVDETGDLPSHVDTGLPRVLQLAELLARLLAGQRPAALGKLLEAGQRDGTLDVEQLRELVPELQQKVAQLADVLALHLPDQRDYTDVLAEAHGRLSREAAMAAEALLRGGRDEPDCLEEETLLGEVHDLADAVSRLSSRPEEPRQPVPHAEPAAVAVETDEAADPGLAGRLATAVAACRQSRCSLSLMLVQLDGTEEYLFRHGLRSHSDLQQLLAGAVASLDHPGAAGLPYGETGRAVILPDCERRQAVELGNYLVREVRRRLPADEMRGANPTVGVGVATVSMPPKNFPADDLLDSADRCLYGSTASGGGVVKSIEIY